MATPKQQVPSVKQKNLFNFFSKTKDTPTQATKPEAILINEDTPMNDNLQDLKLRFYEKIPCLESENNRLEAVQAVISNDQTEDLISTVDLQDNKCHIQSAIEVPQLADLMDLTGSIENSESAYNIESISKEEVNAVILVDEACGNTGIETIAKQDICEINESSVECTDARLPETNLNMQNSDSSVTRKSRRASTKKPAPTIEIVLAPEIIKRIELQKNRILHFTDDLVSWENLAENSDKCIEVKKATTELISQCLLSIGKAEDDFLANSVQIIRNVISSSVQGSPLPLTALSEEVKIILGDAEQAVINAPLSDEELIVSRMNTLKQMLQALQDCVVLSEEIKLLAVRTCYGVNIKGCNVFEEIEPSAVFRWDTINTSHFSESTVQLIKEAKATRARYGRLLVSMSKVVDALSKYPAEPEAKIAELDGKVSKNLLEIEKIKEKKAEAERKRSLKKEDERLRKEEERLKKEAEKKKKEAEREEQRLAKLQEKEIAAEKKRIEAEKKQLEAQERAREKEINKEEKAKKSSEKSQKLVQCEKQKNFFLNFLSKAPAASSSQKSEIVNLTDDVAPSTFEQFDSYSFDDVIRGPNLPMSDIIVYYKDKFSSRSKIHRTRHKPITIYVSVPSNNGFDFSEGYSETKAVVVNSKIKTLRFFHDERPPYVGTFSKHSSLLSGRRPFAKDIELFNYEYDSEAEWEAEEEEDGEDIENSDGGDEEDQVIDASDDLVYDDFFLKDNDFGSDADSDGEDMAATMIRNPRQLGYAVECIGPRFVVGDSMLPTCITTEEREEAQLRAYPAIFLAAKANFPTLGQSHQEPNDPVIEKEQTSTPQSLDSIPKDNSTTKTTEPKEPKREKETQWTVEMTSDLIAVVHGKKESLEKLEEAFHQKYPKVPKTHIRKKIQAVASKEKHPEGHGTARYMVKAEVLEPFADTISPVEFTPAKKKRRLPKPTVEKASTKSTENQVTDTDKPNLSEGVCPLILDVSGDDKVDSMSVDV